MKNATDFGFYDKKILDHIKKINDSSPYLMGLICKLGYPIKTIAFSQPRHEKGISKNNFYTLFDIAMLGMVSHSLVPIRTATIVGFVLGAISFMVTIFYGVMKFLYWDTFPIGMAPLLLGVFFLFNLLLLFIRLLGEYVGSI